MGMAKAFGFFPTIYEEYNKKQVHVDSRYFIYWDHNQFNNQLTIHAHTLSLLSPHTRSNLYTSLQYKLNYTLCSLKYFFNFRGEQTHFKGKRTQGDYVSIRANGHDTVLTWEQFDWKSGGGKEDLKKNLMSRRTVIILYTYIIYIYIPHEGLIPFSYTCTIFLSKPMVCIFIFNMPLVWLFIFISKKNQIFIFKILLVSPRYQMVVPLRLLSDRRGA